MTRQKALPLMLMVIRAMSRSRITMYAKASYVRTAVVEMYKRPMIRRSCSASIVTHCLTVPYLMLLRRISISHRLRCRERVP